MARALLLARRHREEQLPDVAIVSVVGCFLSNSTVVAGDRPSSIEYDIFSAEEGMSELLGPRLRLKSNSMCDHPVMIALLPRAKYIPLLKVYLG